MSSFLISREHVKVGQMYTLKQLPLMRLQFRSIIIVYIVILCNNTSQSCDSFYERSCHELKKDSKSGIKSSKHEQIFMQKECSSSDSSILEKELPTHTDEQQENTATMAAREIIHVEFEVYGKVQGVFFRKNTVDHASKLKLKGWCMNTPNGTVKGAMEGDATNIREMKYWLANVGSKMSRIDKAEFRNEKSISTFTFPNFSVRH